MKNKTRSIDQGVDFNPQAVAMESLGNGIFRDPRTGMFHESPVLRKEALMNTTNEMMETFGSNRFTTVSNEVKLSFKPSSPLDWLDNQVDEICNLVN